MWAASFMQTDSGSTASVNASSVTVAARVRRVSQVYAGGVQALTDIDLELKCGAITALIGANGSGKSTLLRILAAIQEPATGEVELLGIRQPISRRWSLDRAFRSRVTFIPQPFALDPEMTGRETLTLLATLQGVPRGERSARIVQLANSFGLTPLLSRLVRTYSGGQCRRLHVAAGLLADAELLLLDEPTAGLDEEGCTLLWHELVRRVGQGRTVAVVTHDLLRAQQYADHVVLLHAGKLIACGPPPVLIEKARSSAAPAGSREPALARVYRDLTGQAVEGKREGQAHSSQGGGAGRWRRQEE
jgi:ABC-2 type transport system ATP-binding protein